MRRWAALIAAVVLLGAGRHARPVTVFDLADRVGKPLPSLTLQTPTGTPLAFDTLRGRPAFVFLFASWCGRCRDALPTIRADYARYGDRVRFIGIDVYEDGDAARTTLQTAAFPFQTAFFTVDELDRVVPRDEQTERSPYRIPAEVLIDADGTIRQAWRGMPQRSDGTPSDPLPAALAAIGIH